MFLILVIPTTLLGQKQVDFSLNTGLTIHPKGYYLPQVTQTSIKTSFLEYSQYELTSSFAPHIEASLNFVLDRKSAVRFNARYTQYALEYKIQDKAPRQYSPYGHVQIQNIGWQLSSLYEIKVSSYRVKKQNLTIGGGVVMQTNIETKNMVQETMDNMLVDYRLGAEQLQKFGLGLRGAVSYNVRYSRANKGKFVHFSTFGDLISSGMYNNRLGFAGGFSIGIDLN